MHNSLLQRIVELFVRGNLSILLVVLSLLAGGIALQATPREEEPQIVVPLADVFVQAPGLSADEIERLVSTPLERLLLQIDGVEYVYSMSRPGGTVVTVRFFVGEDREDSLVKIYNKIHSNTDIIPADVRGWVIKPVEIDDVPVLNLTLSSHDPERYDDHALRRIAEEVQIGLQRVPDTSRIEVLGGRARELRIDLDPLALAARRTSALEVAWALQVSNQEVETRGFDHGDQRFLVDSGGFFRDADDLRRAVVNVVDGAPVSLGDVARVADTAAETTTYTWHARRSETGADVVDPFRPAVHIAVSKKKGSNAVSVTTAVEARLEELASTLLPAGVEFEVTRNYGETANDKVNELLEGLAVAIIIVIALIALVLGWREAFIVCVAVPITFSLTLLVNYFLGYTINRVTLFALTLALGLVVDDPIVDVENIHRHLRMRREPPLRAVLTAVQEVRPPIILATLAVIVSFVPLFFITGMMGPYMRPMALNVPLAMLMSMVVAFTITPWMSYHILKGGSGHADDEAWVLERSPVYRAYRAVLHPLLRSRLLAIGLLVGTALLFVFALWLGAARLVPLKMLPFDNKNEFQILVDLPEGTTLERTDAATRAMARVALSLPEVDNVQVYSGLASAIDFNGLVRHYYLRQQANAADVRVNLVDKDERQAQSHAIVLRLRPQLEAEAAKWGANVKLVEVPPGPPVLATITAEIYGDSHVPYSRLELAAEAVAARLRREPLVTDVDTTVESEQRRWHFRVDKEKAALSGIATEDVNTLLTLALDGLTVTRLHELGEVSPLPVRLRLPRENRSSVEDLLTLHVKGRPGYTQLRDGGGLRAAPIPVVQLGELGRFADVTAEPTLYHKNMRRVAYVFAETAGRAPAEAILDVVFDQDLASSSPRDVSARSYLNNGGGDAWTLPPGTEAVWTGEGEWQVTLDVFRDLGIAFGMAVFGIYVLIVYQTGSFFMPLILMISIPLTMIGIMPGFWLLNAVGNEAVGAYPNPVFFTATAMIGMIALAGIAVRNAILLIEFVHERLREGLPLEDALLASGAVRFRPIVLTAGTALLAAWPITLDPIFSGLAWALIFGLFVSTAFTLLVIPVTYDLVYRNRPGHGLPQETME